MAPTEVHTFPPGHTYTRGHTGGIDLGIYILKVFFTCVLLSCPFYTKHTFTNNASRALPYNCMILAVAQLSSMLMYGNKQFHEASGSPLDENYFLSDSLVYNVAKVGSNLF